MWVDSFLSTARAVAREADRLCGPLRERSSDVVVNVHAHAWPAYAAFVRRYYADGDPRVAAFSMNPGRNGAVQTGIAFTDARTARELLPDFDRLVPRRPYPAERPETSGQQIKAWARQRFGGLPRLYRRVLFPIAFPLAILRGPGLLNVPIAGLRGPLRRTVDAFYGSAAARLALAAAPSGVLLLGDYAARRWDEVRRIRPELAALPAAVTHHPAAHITNQDKFTGWTRAYRRIVAERGPGTGRHALAGAGTGASFTASR